MENRGFIMMTALIVALGGFLMGFDASVISGVNEFIKPEFNLSSFESGWVVASFAISIGPVMWVLFSDLFPNAVRGIAISFVGLINSAVSFLVQLIFPWELENFGSATAFLIYGVFAVLGLLFIIRTIPETKGRSLEELEELLVGSNE